MDILDRELLTVVSLDISNTQYQFVILYPYEPTTDFLQKYPLSSLTSRYNANVRRMVEERGVALMTCECSWRFGRPEFVSRGFRRAVVLDCMVSSGRPKTYFMRIPGLASVNLDTSKHGHDRVRYFLSFETRNSVRNTDVSLG